MSRPTLHVLLIGDTSRAEFHEAVAALEQLARVTRFADIEAAIAGLEGVAASVANALRGVPVCERTPSTRNATEGVPYSAVHGIVLAQAWPGQYSAEAVDCLRAMLPLARLIAIQGSWCEGEPRSGKPLPGVIPVYWHEAAARFRREFSRWFEPLGSAWRLPPTATDEERLLASLEAPLPKGEGLVAIWTRRPEMERLLADACRRAGYSTAWLHPRQPARMQGAKAAIFDGASLDAAGLAELTELAAAVSPAPVIALLDAPRTQEARLAQSLGAVVIGKPFRIDELLDRLEV